MTLPELLTSLTAGTEVSKKDAKEILTRLTSLISDALVADGSFTLYGLGTWKVIDTAERTGRHPQTGEPMLIPAGKRVKFQATKSLKEAVNG